MTAFLKMHGLGNDFVVFDARKQGLALSGDTARAIADRRNGVGCDQVIVIERGHNGSDAAMRILNSDGGEVEACGNATRCVARLLFEELDRDRVTIDTEAGALACRDAGNGLVTVDMGAPRFDWKEIPLTRSVDTNAFTLTIDGIEHTAAAVSIGNPHCVLFVADAETAPVATLGPRVEIHEMFPARANVEFVSQLGLDRLRMRVWERGTGITRACGTGACAVAAAAFRRGLTGREVDIVLDGGVLRIALRENDGHLLMTGPSALAFRGELDLEAYI